MLLKCKDYVLYIFFSEAAIREMIIDDDWKGW
jgi:hypothetical protein